MFNHFREFKPYLRRLSHHVTPSRPSAANIFISTSSAKSPKAPNPEPFSASYLKNEFGVSPKKALMYSKYLRFDSPEKPLSVIAFLKHHHFNDSQISSLVRKWPLVFRCSTPESIFSPKIEFLRDLGFSSSEIVKILILVPELLKISLEGQLVPCVDFLRSFLHSDQDLTVSILRYPYILKQNLHKTLWPNVGTLTRVGVPKPHISALLRRNPGGIAVGPESFRLSVEELLKLGFCPAMMHFILGLTVIRQLSSSSWKEKVEHYSRWGWSEDQVLEAFRRNPIIMMVSKDKSSRILDFITKTMGCDASVFMSKPVLLGLSFEARIVPRCALYRVLLSEGLIKPGSSLGQMLACPQRLFHEKYVQRFVEKCPELLQLYEDIEKCLNSGHK